MLLLKVDAYIFTISRGWRKVKPGRIRSCWPCGRAPVIIAGDYPLKQDYFFVAHDGGKEIRFEARMVAVCAPRRAFKGKMMTRIRVKP